VALDSGSEQLRTLPAVSTKNQCVHSIWSRGLANCALHVV